MRKQQIQPSLASLSQSDREQLADWLRHGEYDDVLARVNKPRPEGLGLDISKKPLQTFYAKVALLDLINSRLPDDKKLTLAIFETLAHRDILFLSTADASTVAEIHDTILGTVHDLTKSADNTPTQLLSLQRLADFPARAEIRAERLQLQREKEQRAREMHAHKIAMDLRREERAERREQRCVEMHTQKAKRDAEQSARAEKRLEFCGKRLRLSIKSMAFRRKQHRDRMTLAREKIESDSQRATNPSARKSDHLGPIATDWKGVGERVCKLFGITPEEEARRAELHKTWKDPHARPGIPEEINPVD